MKIGDRVLNYILQRELGEGGMGTVYLGQHTILDQQVAIKVLSPLLSRDQAIRERFIREANIQVGLRHPSIVQVLADDLENEQPALIMEYIEGASLAEVLRLRGALPVDDALKIMRQVFAAVGYAHQQGVIHRDLKPSNVMVMASGLAKVTDFGIAKVLGSSQLTRTGTAMGSAHYMSPEQIRRPESVDARSDIYSLGCMFYEVLTGRPPFGDQQVSDTESDFEIKMSHTTKSAPPMSGNNRDIPGWLQKLVMQSLEKDPEDRQSSCEEILRQIAANFPEESTIIGPIIDPPDENPLGLQIDETDKKKKTNAFPAMVPIASIALLLLSTAYFFFEKKSNDYVSEKISDNSPEKTAPSSQMQDDVNPNNLTKCQPFVLYETLPDIQYSLMQRNSCWGKYIASTYEYEGEWSDGLQTGYGIVQHTNGVRYVGDLSNGKSHGAGVLYFAPNDSLGRVKFDGIQNEDRWVTGKLYFSDGRIEDI